MIGFVFVREIYTSKALASFLSNVKELIQSKPGSREHNIGKLFMLVRFCELQTIKQGPLESSFVDNSNELTVHLVQIRWFLINVSMFQIYLLLFQLINMKMAPSYEDMNNTHTHPHTGTTFQKLLKFFRGGFKKIFNIQNIFAVFVYEGGTTII